METQGPPPPPTSSYAYIHPGYMQPPHYGAMSYDPGSNMYRSLNSMLVPGPYGANPYLHPSIPTRYHAPEDLSRSPSGPTKALDLLQHHASQYYSSHKIHELQERALKSPTPKGGGPAPGGSPSAPGPPVSGQQRPPSGGGAPPPGAPPSSASANGNGQNSSAVSAAGAAPSGAPGTVAPSGGAGNSGGNGPGGKSADGKEARSPPPQRHVHTHHHTHVGLGYPILASNYPGPYGGKPMVRP